jgi:small subunit ribosomal protein S6
MSDTFDNSNLYEGLFLMSQSAVGGGLGAAIEHVRDALGRIDAEVITLRKWDDRKLAYPIKGQKRGIYLLSLFRGDGTRLTEVERTCNLSEQVLRVMMTRCDHYGQVEYDAELEEAKAIEAEQKLREQPAEAKPAAKVEAKPEAKAEVKPEAKVEDKPEAKAEVKPEAKVEDKPEAKVEDKPEAKVEDKPEAKADDKPAETAAAE